MLEDTIIAIATPPGFGGLGIVRISGGNAAAVARRVFEPKGRTGRAFPERKPILGAVRDPDGGAALDEAFLTYFKAPRSYTREDVVEISVHGSPAVLEAVLKLGTRAGARAARPGEFTLRAYLNGRLDILQAQAVDDLVRSVSLARARISSRQLGGSLSRRVFRLRDRLTSLLSRLEAGLEFPEDGVRVNRAAIRRTLDPLVDEVGRLAASYETGRALAEGVTLAIVGRTNVGKSTLFNALLEEDRAIVTPFPGTTRDFLRERLVVEGVAFHLVDLAGLGRPAHPVEKAGMAKGRKIAGQADGVLIVLDASRRISPADVRLIRKYGDKKSIIVLNKCDLARRIDGAGLRKTAGASPVVEVSALRGRNIERLRARLKPHFAPGADKDEEIILHARQRDILQDVYEALRRAGGLLAGGHSEEMAAEELRTALDRVGELAGEVRTKDILDEIFGRFCVGK
ncbi:MAG TPA: tRNA uridine-5-carboxymethylaminomethyl(34) synthesis GTPase MnmE [Candidatus Aminicenantes bacterium]|nr:tRNA uridine-5-carboxymethylaminomethyl(34) synthesis GTPase MnmE [Candidatus Aminicenantes bacterium]HRY64207.1 tRNA uridine-5-carboxymethylaminomethyl(34) synthesis GTPase MnmE [Candidatus Aminicenantes bacterium]HRZ71120.1 tRNA uridine-5-carboxymethylaminomethyl(34) synthesis GTPase MnmE [Candidatus Aminicenantes bacterium]